MQTERAEAFFICTNGPISLKYKGYLVIERARATDVR